MPDNCELISKSSFCDLTRYRNFEILWNLENFLPSKIVQCEFILTDSIKMFLELRPNQHFYSGNEYYYGSSYYCINPFVKYVCAKYDSKKLIKLQINSSRGAANCYREFASLNKEFIAVNHQNNFMTQCNLNKYLEKNILTLRIRVTIKEIFDNFSIGNELLERKGKILKDLHALISNERISDFKFVVDGTEFFVHKVLLAARSPVFMKMFTSNFQERTASEGTINDISKEAFQEFLRFIYTETVENIDQHVLELLAISDLYEVEDLKTICKAQLQTGLTEENAPFVFQYAHRYRCDDELKVAAFGLIQGIFARNNISIPIEFVNAPQALQEAVDMKNKIFEILHVQNAIEEMKLK